MSKVTISIDRQKVYAIAEGISVTISQHNAGTPTFEQLWASESESKKLDIYYREAVSDLERRLMEWLSESSGQFDLSADGDNYTLELLMNRFWPQKLEGLLGNKIQDYLVHSVTAGWLNDFDGLTVKQDYQAMAAGDLLDIRLIIYQRDFSYLESARADDTETKDDPGSMQAEQRTEDSEKKDDPESLSAEQRTEDSEKKDDPESLSAEQRTEDSEKKDDPESLSAEQRTEDSEKKDDPESLSAEQRTEDSEKKDDPESLTAEQRTEDSEKKDQPESFSAKARTRDVSKQSSLGKVEAGFRHKDGVRKNDNDNIPFLCRPNMARHHDDAPVRKHTDYTDMSGTDYGRYGSGYGRPLKRPDFGMGATPPPEHRPEPSHHNQNHIPPKEPHIYPEPPYHVLEPKNPNVPHPKNVPFHANGVDWDDAKHYDQEEEERFVNSHNCGQHACDIPEGNALDWDFDDNDNSNNNTENYEQHQDDQFVV